MSDDIRQPAPPMYRKHTWKRHFPQDEAPVEAAPQKPEKHKKPKKPKAEAEDPNKI